MSPGDGEISIRIGLDLQEAYDQARAMERVFRAQLIALELDAPEIPSCEHCGWSLVDQLTVNVDLTDARRKAEALADAWKAAADTLERSGFICTHPEERRINVDESMDICLECERALPKESADGP